MADRTSNERFQAEAVTRPWGVFRSIEADDRFQVKRITVNPGASLSLQMHHHRAEHWVVVSGIARVVRGSETFLLYENQSTYIPIGVTHRLENPGRTPLEVIEIQSGGYLGEDDIVRFQDVYGRSTEASVRSIPGAKFAVSIPVRGGIEYLPFTLESLALQGVPVEIALLDASGGNAIVQKLAKHYEANVSYAYHRDADDGQSAAIQDGWDNTAAPFLAWLNADDFLLPGALRSAQVLFDERPDVDVVYGHSVILSEDGTFIGYFPSITEDLSALPGSNVIAQPACFVRRTAVEKVGGLNRNLHFVMDWDLWLRLRGAGCKFQFLPRPLAAMRNRGAAKTNAGGAPRMKEIEHVLARQARLLQRLKAAVGFRYMGALLRGDRAAAAFWSAGLGAYRALRGRRAEPGMIFGLERVTNRVDGRCTLHLPSLGPVPMSFVILVSDRKAEYWINQDGEAKKLDYLGERAIPAMGGTVWGHAYSGRVTSVSEPLIRLEAWADDVPEWKFLGARLEYAPGYG